MYKGFLPEFRPMSIEFLQFLPLKLKARGGEMLLIRAQPPFALVSPQSRLRLCPNQPALI